eukprot:GHVS01025138.1.p1 GENE.GHVS01025138.1~~GHVS01025138.1.p1  ORF type:complete len:128 (-),score=11.04 GHVS01025138.1:19-402(-)
MQKKTAKDIYRLMSKYEKDLLKLSKYVQDVSIGKFSKGCLPAGLVRHVDGYGDPLLWVQRKVLRCLTKANDELRGTLTAMGGSMWISSPCCRLAESVVAAGLMYFSPESRTRTLIEYAFLVGAQIPL